MRGDFLLNADLIQEKEKALAELIEIETVTKVRQMKLFDCLNSEKPTPMFLSLARVSNSDKKLASICKPNGDNFNDNTERNEYIVNYFKNVYERDQHEPQNFSGCMERFLGNNVLASPVVRNSKLTENEKLDLDSPLTIQELDKSLEQSNIKSAPGIDGISGHFLKEFWPYVHHPLFNYCHCCFDKGLLTQNFRGAAIKLIPKKGEITQLKNWRPISLLSNVYKIISRAINNRLNRIVNRICSRSQKGFNKYRYTQECLINVIETIAYCNDNNVPGAVVAVDMAKAFDTLSHGFLCEVFKFFNFGQYMTKWLELIGQNRTACIILDDGTYSENFNLQRGRAQGDNISPNTFNFGEQILLFKIELDPRIRSVRAFGPSIQIDLPNNNPIFMHESQRETDKNESMTDDNTTITWFETASLAALREILDDFSRISGLQCNYDKTMVMPVGPAVGLNIDTAGFTICNEIKLLGLEISNTNTDFNNSFTAIHEKITNLVHFWERFRLTLPGRVAVYKTLLIPQINYLGCFLTPNSETLRNIQRTMDNFVLNNLNIGTDRRYLPAEQGGLGLFCLDTFLNAQKCSWIQRSISRPIDNWRYDLVSLAPNQLVHNLRPSDINRNANPILYNIVSASYELLSEYTYSGTNYKTSSFVDNPAFTRGPRDNGLIDCNYFGSRFYWKYMAILRNLKFEQCYQEGRYMSIEDYSVIGVDMSIAQWMRLNMTLSYNNRKFATLTSDRVCAPPAPLIDFYKKIKKGSKKFRIVIEQKHCRNWSLPNSVAVQTFSRNVDVVTPEINILTKPISCWNLSFLPNELREFIFLERNNFLKIGTRIIHYQQNASDLCSLCRIINPGTVNRESINHLFLQCPITLNLLRGISRSLGLIYQPLSDSYKEKYWNGITDGKFDLSLYLVFVIFRHTIWKFKIRRIVPPPTVFLRVYTSYLSTIKLTKPSLFEAFLKHFNRDLFLQATG